MGWLGSKVVSVVVPTSGSLYELLCSNIQLILNKITDKVGNCENSLSPPVIFLPTVPRQYDNFFCGSF